MLRLVLPFVVVGLVSSPAFAQQQSKRSPSTVKQEVERSVRAWDDAWNKRDTAALSALFTRDGIFLAPLGVIAHGPDEIARVESNIMKGFGSAATVANRVDQAEALPNGGAWAIGHFTVKGTSSETKGHWAAVYVREGTHLKARMLTGAVEPPPPASSASTQK